jgi:hypothetical protein
MGSQKTQQQQSSTQTTPWAPQASALQTGFNAAGNALSQSQAAAANAPTNYTAQFDPALLGQFSSMLGYANNNNTGALNAAGNQAATNGANASSAALSKLLGYDPTTLNNPHTLIDQANQYVAGQNIPAQVRAAMQGGMETARDVTLPGIAQNAATSGNTDSSRNGIAQGLVERGLAEQSANMQNSLAGQAFGTGLQLASNNANANNQGQLVADNAAANAGNTGLYAGSGAIGSAINGQGNIFGMGENAGQGLTAAQQAYLTNQNQQYQAGINDPYAALNPYMKLVGSQLYGTNSNSQGTATTTSTPGALDIATGILGALGGAATGLGGNGLGWKPFA